MGKHHLEIEYDEWVNDLKTRMANQPKTKPMEDYEDENWKEHAARAGCNVDHPSHYTNGGIECIDAIQEALTAEEFVGYCKGNAIKYIWRERHKNGVEDLQKARWYVNRMIEAMIGA